MEINALLKAADIFVKAVHALTTFHGTSAKYLPSIIAEGLKAFKPEGRFAKGVYFTNDVERAAGYTASLDKPIVLEVNISGQKRVNKVRVDPLDAEEGSSSWNLESSNPYEDDTRAIEKALLDIFGIKGNWLPYEIKRHFNFLDDGEAIDKKNIYQIILFVGQQLQLDKEELKKKIKQYLPPQEFEHIKISDDGTLKLTQEAYDRIHQMYYPKDIPAIAIKYVWIPKSVLKPEIIPNAVESKSIGRKLLIGHIDYLNEEIQRIENKVSWASGDEEDFQELKENIIETLESLKPEEYFVDTLNEVRAASSFEELKECFEYSEPIEPHATFGDEVWYRFPVTLDTLGTIETFFREEA